MKTHIERLMISISDLGFTVPVLIADSTILDGHIRVEAARRLGLNEVPAIDVSHLSPAERRKLALAINRLGELGEWDLDQLRIDFAELSTSMSTSPQQVSLWQEQDIVLLEPLGGTAATGKKRTNRPTPTRGPVTSLGDVWVWAIIASSVAMR